MCKFKILTASEFIRLFIDTHGEKHLLRDLVHRRDLYITNILIPIIVRKGIKATNVCDRLPMDMLRECDSLPIKGWTLNHTIWHIQKVMSELIGIK